MTHPRATLAHLDALTGVRALAALWVFFHHAWLAGGSKPVAVELAGLRADFTPWFAFGWLGLDIFFILSGFLLTRQEWIRHERDAKRRSGEGGPIVDAYLVEPVDDLERDRPAQVLDGRPRLAGAGLEAGPAEHERAVVLVLELLLRVDPAGDRDVAGLPRPCDLDRPRDRHDRGRREDASDAGVAPDRAQQDPPDPEQREAGQARTKGSTPG